MALKQHGRTMTQETGEMTPQLLTHFETLLRQWHKQLKGDTHALLHSIQAENIREADHVDGGTIQEEWETRFGLLENKEKTLQEIEAALHRIADGTFGYSEISGQPISLKRLEAWPIARYTVEEEQAREDAIKLIKR
jgi:DnaK suppressor protein